MQRYNFTNLRKHTENSKSERFAGPGYTAANGVPEEGIMTRGIWLAVFMIAVSHAPALGGPAGNPGSPADFGRNPHPRMPWNANGASRVDFGQVVRHIPVLPPPLTIAVPAVLPAGVPPRTEEYTVDLPGYYVTETTTGFYYPERWTLWQLNVGIYRWVRLPPEFRRK